jgi:hypothetical protein
MPGATRFLAAVALVLAGCSVAPTSAPSPSPATPGPSGSASPAPTASPVTGSLDHPTGADEIVFRFVEGGGFVPMGFFATEAPLLSIYGDGTVIFRDGTPAPDPDDVVFREPPFKIARMTEEELQAFLDDALGDGGLGAAKASYTGPGADLPTATFTINAAGRSKSVSVMALGADREAGPDTPVLDALAALGEKLRAFVGEVEGEVLWTPDRWRGVLTPGAAAPPRAWPWPDIAPVDFVQHPERDAPQFPIRTMTPAEIEVLDVEGIEGGFSGLALAGPDGEAFLFALRPLFPDEAY